ncbi:MAG: glycolate oxidase subunit GlcF [Burkholderiaceae bacterium]|jgi:glycolate oxidase iron-sulfur subunit|nr:glycolate oxidase subunit GlcF [Burkholderiaceae bacterium]
MEIELSPDLVSDRKANEAADIVRRCVHCGFCTATCPTYQLLGDERDGPRGRIYLIKQMLEGESVTRETQQHLDRCLTCRNCETTCPSGVEYGRLVDIGREFIEKKVRRPIGQRLARGLLREGLTSPLFGPAVRLGSRLKSFLPDLLASKLPMGERPRRAWPSNSHARKVILLNGCVQPSLLPNIDLATAWVLDALEVQAVVVQTSGCCGAVRHHLADSDGALNQARRNIDAWWPLLQSGDFEAVLVNASGCAVMVKDYGHLLADDPAYCEKAAYVAEHALDPVVFLQPMLTRLQEILGQNRTRPKAPKVSYHAPCTQQHGMKCRGEVEAFLTQLDVTVLPVADSHLCCGSAGTYSVLQPALAKTLRDNKIQALSAAGPDRILSANVGCIGHLQSGSHLTVQHWLEWLDEALHGSPA